MPNYLTNPGWNSFNALHKNAHPQETADLVTFTEEILNGELHFFCSNVYLNQLYEMY